MAKRALAPCDRRASVEENGRVPLLVCRGTLQGHGLGVVSGRSPPPPMSRTMRWPALSHSPHLVQSRTPFFSTRGGWLGPVLLGLLLITGATAQASAQGARGQRAPQVSAGVPFDGVITTQGTPGQRGTGWAHLSFRAEAGERVRFRLHSDDFDAYLFLLGPRGEVLAFDDDGGGGLNSMLTYTFGQAGVYTLEVTSFGGSNTGRYTLTAEALRVRPAEERPLPLGEAVTLRFAESEGVLRSGEAGHIFHLTLAAGEQVHVTLLPVDGASELFHPGWGYGAPELRVLLLREGSGAVDSAHVTLGGGARLQGIGAGPYRLVLAAPTGLETSAVMQARVGSAEPPLVTPLAPNTSVRGELTEGQGLRQNFESAPLYRLDVPAGHVAVVHLVSDDFDAYLSAVTHEGDLLEDDDSGGQLNARLMHVFGEAGTLLIAVQKFHSGSGTYTLSARVTPLPERVTLPALRRNASLYLPLDERAYPHPELGTPHNGVRIHGEAGERLRFHIETDWIEGFEGMSAGPEGAIDLDDPMAMEVWMDDMAYYGDLDYHFGPVSFSLISPGGMVLHGGLGPMLTAGQVVTIRLPETGIYRVMLGANVPVVRGATLRVDLAPLEQELVVDIEPGQRFTGWLAMETRPGYVIARRRHQLRITEAGVYTLSARFDGPAGDMQLLAADGLPILLSAPGAWTPVHERPVWLEPGSYQWILSTYVGQEISYEINVRAGADERSPERIEIGAEVAGQIGPSARVCPDRGQPAAFYSLTLARGQSVTIDLMSDAFDAFLILTDELGMVVALDDDGGDGLNARLSYTSAFGGTYRISATSFSGGQGAFQLLVR